MLFFKKIKAWKTIEYKNTSSYTLVKRKRLDVDKNHLDVYNIQMIFVNKQSKKTPKLLSEFTVKNTKCLYMFSSSGKFIHSQTK